MEPVEDERDDLRSKTINEVLTSFRYALDGGGIYSGKSSSTRDNKKQMQKLKHGVIIMVVLTPAQQHLMKWLKVMKVEENETIGIMMLLKTPVQRDEMMEWLSRHQKATPSEILGRAIEISEQAMN